MNPVHDARDMKRIINNEEHPIPEWGRYNQALGRSILRGAIYGGGLGALYSLNTENFKPVMVGVVCGIAVDLAYNVVGRVSSSAYRNKKINNR